MIRRKDLIIGNPAVTIMKGLKKTKNETFKSMCEENILICPIKNYRRSEFIISGQISYFNVCSPREAEIIIKGISLKIKDKLIKILYVCFEKGYFINIAIEINGFDLEVSRVFGYNAYNKLWRIHKGNERVKITSEPKERSVVREGILEDILESKSGSIGIEFEGNVFEIQPKHFQKALYYMTAGAIVELEIDIEQEKLLSIEAKDPEARVTRLQEYLFQRELDKEAPTNESLMHYYNSVEHTYFGLIKGKISTIKEDKIVA